MMAARTAIGADTGTLGQCADYRYLLVGIEYVCHANYCITIIITCQAFLCYIYSMKIEVLVVVCAFLLWRPSVAQQQPKPHARGHKSSSEKQVVPPTHVVIDPPFPTVTNVQSQPANAQAQSPEKPLPRFFRPEWVIVYITAVYVSFTGLMLLTIRRQANTMDRQAKDARNAADTTALSAQNTLNEIKRQADLMDAQLKAMEESSKQVNRQIEILERSVAATEKSADAARENIELYISKERARLRVDMKPLLLPATPAPAYTVDFTVSIHGPTAAFITESLYVAYIFPWEIVDNPDLGVEVMSPIHSLPTAIPANSPPLDCYAFLALTHADFTIPEVRADRMFAGVRGFIKYTDVFGRERETHFRYHWKYVGGGLAPLEEFGDWIKSGRPEENRET
jgi:hypothetical protein